MRSCARGQLVTLYSDCAIPRHGTPAQAGVSGAVYHETAPGNGRQAIYLDDEDRQRFFGPLARIRSFAANILRANKVTNMSDTCYRNALGGLDHLAKYPFMLRALNSPAS